MSTTTTTRRRVAPLAPAPRYIIGRAPCGCVVFAGLADAEHAQGVGRGAELAIRAGAEIEPAYDLPTHGFLGPGCPACLRDPLARG